MEEVKEEKSCCSKGTCCGAKALGAIALLAIGAVGGYIGGKHCAAGQAAPALSAPGNPGR